MRNNILVSVIVVTYNSSLYVIETLESIKNQTYQNIELIISDDCSNDDTVTKVKEWIKNNTQRFVNLKVIIAPQNGGVAKNCNQGYKNAEGEYLKYVAGDDILLPNCIQDNVEFIINNPHIPIVFSNIVLFGENSEKIAEMKAWKDEFRKNFDLDAKIQFEKLLYGKNFVPAVSMFIKRAFLEKMGGFDERFPMLEDWPFWTKITYNGIKLNFFEKETVMYRISNESLSIVSGETRANPKCFDSEFKFFITIRAKHMPWLDYWDNLLRMIIIKLCIIFGNKKSHYKLFRWINLLNPKSYWLKIEKIFCKTNIV